MRLDGHLHAQELAHLAPRLLSLIALTTQGNPASAGFSYDARTYRPTSFTAARTIHVKGSLQVFTPLAIKAGLHVQIDSQLAMSAIGLFC